MSMLPGSTKYYLPEQKDTPLPLNKTIQLLKDLHKNKYYEGCTDTRIQGLDFIAKIYGVSTKYLSKKVYEE